MTKVMRKIIKIDEDKCDGCGICAEACHEGAIQIIGGKAKLVSETYCDGLGDCIGECPRGAITFEEREAAPYDEEAVKKHMAAKAALTLFPAVVRGPRYGDLVVEIRAPKGSRKSSAVPEALNPFCQLVRRCPALVPERPPYLRKADLVIAADCNLLCLCRFPPHLSGRSEQGLPRGLPEARRCTGLR